MIAQMFKPKISITEDFRNRVLSDVKVRLSYAVPLKAIVFGSFADGTAHVDSDIDVLVVCRDSADLKRVRNVIYSNLTGPITCVPIDFIFVTEADFDRKRVLGGVCMVADETGFLIFEPLK